MRQGWVYKKLNEVCDKGSSNIVINKLEDNNGDYPLFGASGLVKNVDFYHQDKPYIGIVKDGAGVGRVNTYPAFSSLVGTMQYIFAKDDCLLDYIKYFLVKLDLSHCVSGATIPHIYFKDYGKERIPVPPMSIQKSIVAELDKINELIGLKEMQLNNLDSLAQSIFNEMFGDPIENEKGWEKKKYEDVCVVITDGEHNTPKRESHGILLLSARNIHNHRLELQDVDYIGEEEYNRISKRIIPQAKDILISCSGSVGRVCSVPDEMKFQMVRSVALLRLNSYMNNVFFEYLISSDFTQEQITKAKTNSAQANLFQGRIKKLIAIVPPLSLQQSFAKRISAIEQQKQQIIESIKDLETLLASRMQYWFD